MKYVKIIGKAKIHGINTEEGLMSLNGYFASDYEAFASKMSKDEIADILYDKHKEQLDKIRSDTMYLEFK